MLVWQPFAVAIDIHSHGVPVSAISFDTFAELLWLGYSNGRLVSYAFPSLSMVSSIKAHEGPIKQILCVDEGVATISSTLFRFSTRGGVVLHEICDERTKNLECMAIAPRSTSSMQSVADIYIAGQQNRFLIYNVLKHKIVKEIWVEEHIMLMKRATRYVICATSHGGILFLDPRSLSIVHKVNDHSAAISDLDVCNDILVTCGYSMRSYGQSGSNFVPDPLVKAIDLRTFKSLHPVPFSSGASFVRFQSTSPYNLLIASYQGISQWTNIQTIPSTVLGVFKATLMSTRCFVTKIDISSSGRFVVIGDSMGNGCIYTDIDPADSQFRLNEHSIAIEVPERSLVLPSTWLCLDESSNSNPLSFVGVPYYDQRLLSSQWPTDLVFEVGQPAITIDSEMLKNSRQMDFVTYVPNLGTRHRNQIQRQRKDQDTPKFRSEKKRTGLPYNEGSTEDREEDTNLNADDIPSYFRHVEIKYSKFGVDDFDFEFFNQTKFAGLETHIINSYANSLLQLLYFQSTIRNILMKHLSSGCEKSNCLSCELAFLFRMLDQSTGQTCQATNFLKSFADLPQAQGLGLLEPESASIDISYGLMIQNFNRFFLEHLHRETNQPHTSKTSESLPFSIQQEYGLSIKTTASCKAGKHAHQRETVIYTIDLMYSKRAVGAKELPITCRTFSALLKHSLARETTTRAWCETCKDYQLITQRRSLQEFPEFINVNCGLGNLDDLIVWQSKQKFLPLTITLFPLDGSVDVQEGELEGGTCFDLVGYMVEVRKEKCKSHLVSIIRVPEIYLLKKNIDVSSCWYVFNDFLVTQVSSSQVGTFYGNSVIPTIVMYKRRDSVKTLTRNSLENDIFIEPKLPLDIFLRDPLITGQRKPHLRANVPFVPLSPEELKGPMLCAMDAEFVSVHDEEVEVRSDGTRALIRPKRFSLARLSVVRGEGKLDGIPFVDDYIVINEPIVEYLTEHSGIMPGDLDPSVSSFDMAALRTAYTKLRVLVDMGCTFIGHGLNKDLRTINLLIPPSQIIDTLTIYHIPGQRKISLKYLAWYMLGLEIQTVTHDSVEDARTALALYKKYKEMELQFNTILTEIYAVGRLIQWKPENCVQYKDRIREIRTIL